MTQYMTEKEILTLVSVGAVKGRSGYCLCHAPRLLASFL